MIRGFQQQQQRRRQQQRQHYLIVISEPKTACIQHMYRVYAHDVRNLLQTAGNFFTDSQQLVFISKYFQVIIMTFSLKCSLKTCTEKTCTVQSINCLLYTSPSPRDRTRSRMPSSA